jgi:hypothetical protein
MVTMGKMASKQLNGGKEYENFSGKKLPSRAIWAKPTPMNTLTATFQTPGHKYGAGALVITSLNHGSNIPPCRIALELNGTVIYDGVDPSKAQDWKDSRFPVPEGVVKNGTNTLRILNMEEKGGLNAPPWYMVHAVELFAAPAK